MLAVFKAVLYLLILTGLLTSAKSSDLLRNLEKYAKDAGVSILEQSSHKLTSTAINRVENIIEEIIPSKHHYGLATKATVDQGYAFTTLYNAQDCTGDAYGQVGLRLGTCFYNETSGNSLYYTCESTTDVVTRYLYESGDCSGSSTVSELNFPTSCFNTQLISGTGYTCSTSTGPWTSLGEAFIVFDYTQEGQCENQNLYNSIQYFGLTLGACAPYQDPNTDLDESVTFDSCSASSYIYTTYSDDTTNCTGSTVSYTLPYDPCVQNSDQDAYELQLCFSDDPMDWQGTFNDPVWGGDINVCVTYTIGIYFGQGLFSNLGYMRGTITGNVFTGNYWIAGYEALQGSFSLSLNGTAGSRTYEGTFIQAPGYSYNISGSQTSTTSPTDLQCFKTDASLLISGSTVDYFTGAWINDLDPITTPWYLYVEDGMASASYTYFDSDYIPGTSYGPVYHFGQVSVDNWYEPGADEGMELTVVKNATHMYNLWWFYPRTADFQYSNSSSLFDAKLNVKDTSVSPTAALAYAGEYICYALWEEAEENDCLEGFSESSDDDDDTLVTDLVITVSVFVVLIFILSVVTLVLWCTKKKPSLATQGERNESVELSSK